MNPMEQRSAAGKCRPDSPRRGRGTALYSSFYILISSKDRNLTDSEEPSFAAPLLLSLFPVFRTLPIPSGSELNGVDFRSCRKPTFWRRALESRLKSGLTGRVAAPAGKLGKTCPFEPCGL